jgi:hypothetical protein
VPPKRVPTAAPTGSTPHTGLDVDIK